MINSGSVWADETIEDAINGLTSWDDCRQLSPARASTACPAQRHQGPGSGSAVSSLKPPDLSESLFSYLLGELATAWQIDGGKWKVTDFIFLGSKITANGDCSHKIKRSLLWRREAMTSLDSILKSRDITLLTKVRLVKLWFFQ